MPFVDSVLLSFGAREVLGCVAVLTTAVGIWLQWMRPTHLSDIEESVKNGTMAADEAYQRTRFVDRRATGLVIAGVSLLIVAALGWAG